MIRGEDWVGVVVVGVLGTFVSGALLHAGGASYLVGLGCAVLVYIACAENAARR